MRSGPAGCVNVDARLEQIGLFAGDYGKHQTMLARVV